MKTEEAIAILEAHNKWRRNKEVPNTIDMVNPEELGVAIDTVIRKLKNNDVLLNVSKCDCLESRELLKAFLEHMESTIDYLPCEPSELIDDYYKSNYY